MTNVKMYCLVSLLYPNILDSGKYGLTWFPSYFVHNISSTKLHILFSFLFWVRKKAWKLKRTSEIAQFLYTFIYVCVCIYESPIISVFPTKLNTEVNIIQWVKHWLLIEETLRMSIFKWKFQIKEFQKAVRREWTQHKIRQPWLAYVLPELLPPKQIKFKSIKKSYDFYCLLALMPEMQLNFNFSYQALLVCNFIVSFFHHFTRTILSVKSGHAHRARSSSILGLEEMDIRWHSVIVQSLQSNSSYLLDGK